MAMNTQRFSKIWLGIAATIMLVGTGISASAEEKFTSSSQSGVQPYAPLQEPEIRKEVSSLKQEISNIQQKLGNISNPTPKIPNNTDIQGFQLVWLGVIVLGGACGGIIYGISKSSMLEWPNLKFKVRKSIALEQTKPTDLNQGSSADQPTSQYYDALMISPGLLREVFVGIGGGILIFMIAPSVTSGGNLLDQKLSVILANDQQVGFLLRTAATAMIGGFAGTTLFSQAAQILADRVNVLEKATRDTSQITGLIEEQNTAQAAIQFRRDRYLDPTIATLESDLDEIKSSLKTASYITLNTLFDKASEVHKNNSIMSRTGMGMIPDVELDKCVTALERAYKIFEALRETAQDKINKGGRDLNYHRYIAHMAFCTEDLACAAELRKTDAIGQWEQADKLISQAIDARDDSKTTPDITAKDVYWHYGVDKALCCLKRGSEVNAKNTITSIESAWVKKIQTDQQMIVDLLREYDHSYLIWLSTNYPQLVPPNFQRDGITQQVETIQKSLPSTTTSPLNEPAREVLDNIQKPSAKIGHASPDGVRPLAQGTSSLTPSINNQQEEILADIHRLSEQIESGHHNPSSSGTLSSNGS